MGIATVGHGGVLACVPFEFGAADEHGQGLHCASVGMATVGHGFPTALVPLELFAAEEHGQGLQFA